MWARPKKRKRKSMEALLEVFYTFCMGGLVLFGDGGQGEVGGGG